MERREFLLEPDESLSRHRLAEVAGGTTAECAAVVCCFPCTVVHFIVLAVYKVPAGLYRKAVNKKRRRQLIKKGMLIETGQGGVGAANGVVHDATAERFMTKSMESDDDFIELENEMWDKFYGTGFFRSLSQRVN
ncbi:uncharacterized protein LOC143550704 [Bidens hawaiensis]|uniref:uncharacterized protein LOC143550704 n=1 Tax=Bidens hawaiensis TaxID=980011 RepID=UPI00404AD341